MFKINPASNRITALESMTAAGAACGKTQLPRNPWQFV